MRPIVLLRTDQATFPDYTSDTFSNRDIVGDRLTGGPANNRRIAYDQAILSGYSCEISLAKLVGLVAQSAKSNDTL